MIPDRTFLRSCAHKNNLNLPQDLENWLLVHFEDEPYEDFNNASVLEDMVVLTLFLVILLFFLVFFFFSPVPA